MMFSIKDTKYDENFKIDLSGYATTSTTDKLTISIDSFITNTNDVLKNHYDALNIILGKLGLEDGDKTDGSKVTPTETTTD